MVGRARVSGKDDKKTLYVKRLKKDVSHTIKALERQADGYHRYEMAYGVPKDLKQNVGDDKYNFLAKFYHGDESDWKNAKYWFGLSHEDCKPYINGIAKSLLARDMEQYKRINDELSAEEMVGQTYLEYQLSWFGKKYSVEDDVTYCDKEKSKKKFVAFLENYARKKIEICVGEQTQAFSKEFIRLFDSAFYKSDPNKRTYGAKKMNKLLQKEQLGYFIDGRPQIGPWIVCKQQIEKSKTAEKAIGDVKYSAPFITREHLSVLKNSALPQKTKGKKQRKGLSKHE